MANVPVVDFFSSVMLGVVLGIVFVFLCVIGIVLRFVMRTLRKERNKYFQDNGYAKAHYMGVRVWYNETTHDMTGRTWLEDKNLSFAIWFDINILGCRGFEIIVEVEPKKESNGKVV